MPAFAWFKVVACAFNSLTERLGLLELVPLLILLSFIKLGIHQARNNAYNLSSVAHDTAVWSRLVEKVLLVVRNIFIVHACLPVDVISTFRARRVVASQITVASRQS